MAYTNSSLATYKKLSPNHSGKRTHSIDRITPHCVVGQLSVESIANCFASTSSQASSNYAIGKDGRIGLIVEEKNRSWCTSSNANDQRAITVEIASDTKHPYTMNTAAYNKLIELCVDICKRNGKTKLLWFSDKTKSLNYTPKSNEMVLTVHRWFANKSCPGDWLYSRLDDVATEVTKKLTKKTTSTASTKEKKASESPKSSDKSLSGKYKTTIDLNIRNGAGTSKSVMVVIPKGTVVENFGYYTSTKSVKWLYVQFEYKGVKYTGYASANRLTKATSKKYFKKYTGNSGSIVDSLKAIGVDSSFAYREKIAKANGIKSYTSTASQNIKLLNLLKQGKLIVP